MYKEGKAIIIQSTIQKMLSWRLAKASLELSKFSLKEMSPSFFGSSKILNAFKIFKVFKIFNA